MVKSVAKGNYTGRAHELVSWDVLLQIFDTIWGKNARSLPTYPAVIGGVNASWHDSKGTEYDAESLDDIEEAYLYRLENIIDFT